MPHRGGGASTKVSTQKSIVTLPIGAVTGMLSAVQLRWADQPGRLRALTEGVGIPFDLMHDANARVTAQQYVMLCTALFAELDDECLGFLSRPARPGSFKLLSRSVLGASKVGSGLHRLAQALTLLQDDVIVRAEREGRLFGITIAPREGQRPVLRFGHEFLLRVCWRIADWVMGGQARARRFDFVFPRPKEFGEDIGDYRRIFPAEHRFDQPHTAVWFDYAEVERPLRLSEADVVDFLRGTPDNVFVTGLIPVGTAARVQAFLRHAAPAWPDLPEVAAELGMSVSSLQRHLASEGTSFREVRDGLRRDMALATLATGSATLSRLAGELGFADDAAFQRAFKAWTGTAPGQYRERMRLKRVV